MAITFGLNILVVCSILIFIVFLGKRGGKNKVPQMERRKGEKGKRTKRKGGS